MAALLSVSGEQQVFLKEPKNKKFRTITIQPSALKKLPAHRKAQQEYRDHFDSSYQRDFIFCNPDGSPLKQDTISASVSLLFRSLTMPKGASVHTLRHTYGSHLMAAGVPQTDVSKRLGHVNPHVTATVLAHALDGRDDLGAAVWDSFQKNDRPAKRARSLFPISSIGHHSNPAILSNPSTNANSDKWRQSI